MNGKATRKGGRTRSPVRARSKPRKQTGHYSRVREMYRLPTRRRANARDWWSLGKRAINIIERFTMNPHCRALLLSRLAIMGVLFNLACTATHAAAHVAH